MNLPLHWIAKIKFEDRKIERQNKNFFQKHRLLTINLAIAVLALHGFAFVMRNVLDGDSLKLDEKIFLMFRDTDDITSPWGPPYLEEMMRDITALGGTAVLTLLIIVTTIYMLARKRKGQALYLFCAALSGMIVSNLIKLGIDRPRPDLVPHGSITYLPSFPSGHSLMSAVVYLTLGALLAETHKNTRMKSYFIFIAAIVVIAIGISRVYLGVHWPSDVIAGWLIGAAWALIFWSINHYFKIRQL